MGKTKKIIAAAFFITISFFFFQKAKAAEANPIFYESFDSLSSIQSNGGTVSNINIVDGQNGQGGQFLSAGSSLSYSNNGKFNIEKGTIDFWVKPNWDGDNLSARRFLFEARSEESDFKIFVYKGATKNYFVFRVDQGSSILGESNTSSKEPLVMDWNAGEWHRVQVYWDFTLGDKSYMSIFLDEEIVSNINISYVPSFSNLPATFNIGSRYDNSDSADAVIDEFKIYDENIFDGFLKNNIEGTGIHFSDNSGGNLYVIDPIVAKEKNIIFNSEPSPDITFPSNATLSVTGVSDDFEPASFVIRPSMDLDQVEISISDLTSGNNSLSSSVVDLRIVKNWYQAGYGVVFKSIKVLVPELLLKDDSLVRVDYDNATNYLKINSNGEEQYIDISSPSATLPSDITFQDSNSLQPFSVSANTNKQIWVTFKIPTDTPSGTYRGTLTIKNNANAIGTVPIEINVLPFKLHTSPLEYGIFYSGKLKDSVSRITAEEKTATQYELELRNMKDHGVLYPFSEQAYDTDAILLGQSLDIRNNVGLPNDKLYSIGIRSNPTSETGIATMVANIAKWKTVLSQHGYDKLFLYGKDEAKGSNLLAERPAWQAVHDAGAFTVAAGSTGTADAVGDLLDLLILAGNYNTDEAEKMHEYGHRISIYAYPQVGVEDSELYRRNYGIQLACKNYDSAMDFSYQYGSESFGDSVWNDFDMFGKSTIYRDLNFTYPTSSAPIDTIEWEGFREAVKDVRYLATLADLQGIEISETDVCDSINSTTDLGDLRAQITSQIQQYDFLSPNAPKGLIVN